VLHLNINKQLQEFKLNINIDIADKQLVAVGGDSGSGKTTLIRTIAGLTKSDSCITYRGDIWQNYKYCKPSQKRGLGYVPQGGAVFPNMTVKENLLFVKNDTNLCDKLLYMVGILNLKETSTKSLSGGQLQRVALCRAFMRKPTILLLDEPLSNIHSTLKNKLIKDIKTIHDEFGTTTILVSHNFEEIQDIGDRFVVLDHGKIIQDSTSYVSEKISAIVTNIDKQNAQIVCSIDDKNYINLKTNSHINIYPAVD
jgi:molybdate transport system ATP-binding protein